MPGKELSWLPREQLDRMHSDLMAQEGITRAQLAAKVLEDAAPLAAYQLVQLATSSEDENIRLKASMYLVDREMGKPKTSVQLNTTEQNPVLKFLDGVIVERPVAPDHEAPGPYDTYEEHGSATVIDQEPPRPRRNPFNPEENP